MNFWYGWTDLRPYPQLTIIFRYETHFIICRRALFARSPYSWSNSACLSLGHYGASAVDVRVSPLGAYHIRRGGIIFRTDNNF